MEREPPGPFTPASTPGPPFQEVSRRTIVFLERIPLLKTTTNQPRQQCLLVRAESRNLRCVERSPMWGSEPRCPDPGMALGKLLHLPCLPSPTAWPSSLPYPQVAAMPPLTLILPSTSCKRQDYGPPALGAVCVVVPRSAPEQRPQLRHLL